MKSLDKGLDVLEIFLNSEEDEIGLSRIVKLSGLKKATVHRILSTLVNRKYLTQSKSWGKYSLGAKILSFNSAIQRMFKINNVARPYLVKLNQLTQETAFLLRWDGGDVTELDAVESRLPLRVVSQEISQMMPPYYKAGVKIFLADMTDEELEEYFQNLASGTQFPNTIMDFDELKKQLIKVTQTGLAYNDGEELSGIRSVAAAIRNSKGKTIASIGFVGPSFRLAQERIIIAAETVSKYAMEISRNLQYTDDDVVAGTK